MRVNKYDKITTYHSLTYWNNKKPNYLEFASVNNKERDCTYNDTDHPVIALLSPRTDREQLYSERNVIFTNDSSYVKSMLGDGWEAMLKKHYDERKELDKGPKYKDNSWVRSLTEPIYAKVRRQRRKY